MTIPAVSPSLLRSLVNNTVRLTSGRILLALLRFIATIVIVQRAGLEKFGEFALILSFVLIAEWLSDFGLTDIAVRQILAKKRSSDATMGAFAVSKLVQGAVACLFMWVAVSWFGHPAHMVQSALIAGGAVVLYCGVQIHRVGFRTRMLMGRDVGAELVSAVVFLAAIWIVTGTTTTLEALTLCFVLSRAVNLVAAWMLAGRWPKLSFGRDFRAELAVLAAACVPLGLTGLMVCAYDAMDAIALARWSTSAEVGVFTVAMRFLMLAVIAEQALSTAVFPLLAAQWNRDRPAFAKTYQVVLDWGMVAGGALFCALYAGARELGALARQDPQAIADVLQLLSWGILSRVVVTLLSPMVVVSGRLNYTVWITALVVAAKWIALTVMAPGGALGAATAYVVVEIGIGLIPTVVLCQRAAGVRLNWSIPLRIVALTIAIAAATRLLDLDGSLLHAVCAVLAYFALAGLVGAIKMKSLSYFYRSLGRRHGGNV